MHPDEAAHTSGDDAVLGLKSGAAAARRGRPAAFAALIGANVALAFGPLFVRLSDTGPVASAFWRLALAAPVLLVAASIGRSTPRRPTPGLWWVVLLAGLCFAADLASWHIGILRTTLANATLFGNSATLIFPIYGFVAARRWPSAMQAVALMLATIGGVLLMGRFGSSRHDTGTGHLDGDLMCLLAGVLYTGYFILMARARSTMPPVPALAWATMAGIAPMVVFVWLLGETLLPHHWGPLIGLALGSQIVGQGLMILALGRLSPIVVGIGLLTQPVVAATIGWGVFHERLGLLDWIGAALVAIALVLVRARPQPGTSPAARPPAVSATRRPTRRRVTPAAIEPGAGPATSGSATSGPATSVMQGIRSSVTGGENDGPTR